ncbi:MAG: TIGR00269 family protein [Promethearchaeota archaeon]|nr:MAG: TIGR00269 family protein [Candidatus Lokiarchaeota archaeon]
MKESRNNYPISDKILCSICNEKNAIYKRKHSGQYLCETCFISSIEKIINKTISKYNLLIPKDKIIVGVSGGKDSITLLYNLKKIQEKTYNSKPLIAISIDEGIEDYSPSRMKIVEKVCNDFNIRLEAISFQQYITKSLDQIVEFKENNKNFRYPCNYCATIKRRLLNDVAKDLGGTVLALGHNLTDISETYLMNILYNRLPLIARGGLLRKTKKQDNIYLERIFPLMNIPENEIDLYVKLKNLDYYRALCPYRINYPILRKKVYNFIQNLKKTSPEIEFNLLNGSLELSTLLEEKYSGKEIFYCPECGYPTPKPSKCRYCSLLEDLI